MEMKFSYKINKEYIFADDRPFESCHAATLIVLENGEVLAAWFGGTREKDPDVAIWLSRRKNDEWSYPVVVADEKGLAHWNPVLFQAPDGRIILYYKVGINDSIWYTRYCESFDLGQTWTHGKELVPGDIGGRGPVKNKPIILHDGTWLAPASTEFEYWDSFVDISYDQGITWIKSEMVPIDHKTFPKEGIIQPTLWESEPGKVHMLLRSSCSWICRSDSDDGGKTWSKVYKIDLPNNNSGIDVAKINSSLLALIYNPVHVQESEWGKRTPLLISFSTDNGYNWHNHITLEHEKGEYSYPSMVAVGNELHAVYTWKRERIAYVKCSIK